MKFSIKDFFGKLNKSAVSCGFDHISLREKYPNKEVFLVSIFPHLDWERRDTPFLSVFSPNAGKYEPEKTPYLDIFHVVFVGEILNGELHFCAVITLISMVGVVFTENLWSRIQK